MVRFAALACALGAAAFAARADHGDAIAFSFANFGGGTHDAVIFRLGARELWGSQPACQVSTDWRDAGFFPAVELVGDAPCSSLCVGGARAGVRRAFSLIPPATNTLPHPPAQANDVGDGDARRVRHADGVGLGQRVSVGHIDTASRRLVVLHVHSVSVGQHVPVCNAIPCTRG